MARKQRMIAASPPDVFGVLLDPGTYGSWLRGARRIRDVDATFPQPGSRLYHAVDGRAPDPRDTTRVLAIEPCRYLLIDACFRGFGPATVRVDLEPVGGATRTTLTETPKRRGPHVALAVRLRTARSLRRLRRIAERRVHGRAR